jgi:hypothetical protein
MCLRVGPSGALPPDARMRHDGCGAGRPLGAAVTAARERKLMALATVDPALAEAVAIGAAMKAVLAGHPRLPRTSGVSDCYYRAARKPARAARAPSGLP